MVDSKEISGETITEEKLQWLISATNTATKVGTVSGGGRVKKECWRQKENLRRVLDGKRGNSGSVLGHGQALQTRMIRKRRGIPTKISAKGMVHRQKGGLRLIKNYVGGGWRVALLTVENRGVWLGERGVWQQTPAKGRRKEVNHRGRGGILA